MRINASAGRDRKKDLRDFCYKLTLTADHPDQESADLEGELLSRLYREMQGNSGSLLFHLRKVQDEKKEVVYRPAKNKRAIRKAKAGNDAVRH